MNKQYTQLDRLNKELEIRHTRTANLDIRNKWLHNKKIKNYQSEYDRIRSHMAHSVNPAQTIELMDERLANLRKLGAQAVGGIRN
jgi:predicted RNase H-like nuclease (RuvC/YqgF family)